MRLFHQLTEEEQQAAVETAVGHILQDIIDGDITFETEDEPPTEELRKEQKALKAVIKKMQTLETYDEKFDLLVENEDVMDFAFGIAYELYKQYIYMEPQDRIMFPEDYMQDHECENCKTKRETEEKDQIEHQHHIKKKHNVN